MSDGSVKIGDYRFVYDNPSEDSGRLLRYSGAESNPEWVAVATVRTVKGDPAQRPLDTVDRMDEGDRTVVIAELLKSAGRPKRMHAGETGDWAKMFRALDNAVKAVEKANTTEWKFKVTTNDETVATIGTDTTLASTLSEIQSAARGCEAALKECGTAEERDKTLARFFKEVANA